MSRVGTVRRGPRAVWARATSSVSGETGYVVPAEDPGQKADAAAEPEGETLNGDEVRMAIDDRGADV